MSEIRSLLDIIPVDYEKVPRTKETLNPAFGKYGLVILYDFVIHSDYDGEFSIDQCKAVSEMLETLIPFLNMEDEDDKEYWERMKELIDHAVEHNTTIIFC